MSSPSKITLLNLSEQLTFELDDKVKKDLCFGETLILSCGHYEGDLEEASSESEWTCRDSTVTESSSKVSVKKPPEQTAVVLENSVEEEEEDQDFHFFFFPDCAKPLPPKNSKDSVLIVDGLPQVNVIAKKMFAAVCTCEKNKKGECECFVKIPCYCGAIAQEECTCHEKKDICICKPFEPSPECVCDEEAKVCTCFPGKIFAECGCSKVEKPCICRHRKFTFPSPECMCKGKPGSTPSSRSSYPSFGEDESLVSDLETKERIPCECQKKDEKQLCYCTKGKKCICKTIECICGVQNTCVCLPTDSESIQCKDEPVENKSICSCDKPLVCTCGQTISQCTCFPIKICNCGDPENCKCYQTCDCVGVCVCDTKPVTEKACTCVDTDKVPVSELICTCPKKDDNKLRKVRAGKQGYRWCHEVDPYHTYFDYGYDRYDKVEKKESVTEKVVIQGLHDAVSQEDVCPIHEIKAPKYEKKVRRPSLDCCSAVGGMSISVEALGEDKDKLLVQAVMYSSKEGAKTGSRLVTILDCNLHTLEENRTEYIAKNNLTKERRSYMAICESGYYNKLTRICGEKYVVKRVYHTFEDAHDFLLEGGNIVLLRYLALIRHKGKIKTDTVMMDGQVCQSIYDVISSSKFITHICKLIHGVYLINVNTDCNDDIQETRHLCCDLVADIHAASVSYNQVCHGVSQALVNHTAMFVVKIERHIIEPSGYVHQTLTVLTLRGHIVSHEWADNSYVLHINPLLNIIPEKDEIEEHAPLRKKWREDLQLLSDYLDFKTVRTSEGGRYMTESGALTGVVRDYLQAILLLRPQDTVHFTRHYFGSVLSALDLPHDEYFDPPSRHVRYYFFEQ